jgi:hypothetical protein
MFKQLWTTKLVPAKHAFGMRRWPLLECKIVDHATCSWLLGTRKSHLGLNLENIYRMSHEFNVYMVQKIHCGNCCLRSDNVVMTLLCTILHWLFYDWPAAIWPDLPKKEAIIFYTLRERSILVGLPSSGNTHTADGCFVSRS